MGRSAQDRVFYQDDADQQSADQSDAQSSGFSTEIFDGRLLPQPPNDSDDAPEIPVYGAMAMGWGFGIFIPEGAAIAGLSVAAVGTGLALAVGVGVIGVAGWSWILADGGTLDLDENGNVNDTGPPKGPLGPGSIFQPRDFVPGHPAGWRNGFDGKPAADAPWQPRQDTIEPGSGQWSGNPDAVLGLISQAIDAFRPSDDQALGAHDSDAGGMESSDGDESGDPGTVIVYPGDNGPIVLPGPPANTIVQVALVDFANDSFVTWTTTYGNAMATVMNALVRLPTR